MSHKKKSMHKLKEIIIKTGTAEEFMTRVKSVMQSADKHQCIEPSQTLVFEEASEMLQFLTETKLRLIHEIRQHPGSITNIAKSINRNRSAVYRDIHQMEQFGLVQIKEEVNPGHGRHKIVQVAAVLKLEVTI